MKHLKSSFPTKITKFYEDFMHKKLLFGWKTEFLLRKPLKMYFFHKNGLYVDKTLNSSFPIKITKFYDQFRPKKLLFSRKGYKNFFFVIS